MLRDQLAEAERLLEEGERELARQRNIVAELVCRGRGKSEIADLARELLKDLQQTQSQLIAKREPLLISLSGGTGTGSASEMP